MPAAVGLAGWLPGRWACGSDRMRATPFMVSVHGPPSVFFPVRLNRLHIPESALPLAFPCPHFVSRPVTRRRSESFAAKFTDNDFHPCTPLPFLSCYPFVKEGRDLPVLSGLVPTRSSFLASLEREFCQRRPDMPVKSSLVIALVPTSSTCPVCFAPLPRTTLLSPPTWECMDGWMDVCMRP